MTDRIEFTLNGNPIEENVRPLETLQTVLRERLQHFSVKSGCDQGGCGSCTVLVDGDPVVSCLLPAAEVHGAEVTTLEGITPDHGLNPIQESFLENYGMQCGYCTPGMIMKTQALFDDNPDPSTEEMEETLGENICRCTGYYSILDSVEDAKEALSGQAGD